VKILRSLLVSLASLLALVIFIPSGQATTVVVKDIQQLVEGSGSGATWIDGKLTKVTEGKNAFGWQVVDVEIEGAKINRPPAPAPSEGKGLQDISGDSNAPVEVFKYSMVGSLGREVIRGLGLIPSVGTEGIMCIRQPSPKTGLTQFCGTVMQGLFKNTGGDQVVNSMGNKNLKLKKVQNKNLRTPGAQKALKNLQGVEEGPLPKGPLKVLIQDLWNSKWSEK